MEVPAPVASKIFSAPITVSNLGYHSEEPHSFSLLWLLNHFLANIYIFFLRFGIKRAYTKWVFYYAYKYNQKITFFMKAYLCLHYLNLSYLCSPQFQCSFPLSDAKHYFLKAQRLGSTLHVQPWVSWHTRTLPFWIASLLYHQWWLIHYLRHHNVHSATSLLLLAYKRGLIRKLWAETSVKGITDEKRRGNQCDHSTSDI